MALELLGGPYDVVDPNTGDAISLGSIGGDTYFVEPRGLIIETTVGNGPRLLIQYDGAAYYIGKGLRRLFTREPALLVIDGSEIDPHVGRRAYGELGWPLVGDLALYEREPNTLVGITAQEIDTIPEAQGNSGRGMVFLPDRVIRHSGAYVQAWSGAAWVNECPLLISDAYYMSWGAEPGTVWFSNRLGIASLYDYVGKQVLGLVATGVTNLGLYFWRKQGIFVSLHASSSGPYTLQTRVWASTPRPASVSVPEFSPAPVAGRRSTVTVRVAGTYAEGCAGEVVAWSTNVGTLADASSVTDDDGYARTSIVVPPGATGDLTIGAEVHV